MTHIDEHILEFHVLGVAETAGRKMEIEAHLAECTGCRVLAENIRKFYQDASKELASGTEVVHKSAGSLVRRKSQNSLIYEPIVGPVINMPPLKMQRFRRIVRDHPIISGGGGLAIALSVVMALLMFLKQPSVEMNPSYIHENEVQGTIEAFNKADEKLWAIPVSRLKDFIAGELRDGTKYTQVVDIDGDGRSEVVTSLPLVGNFNNAVDRLHILRYDKTLLRDLRVGETIRYRNRVYPDDFHITWFAIGDYSRTGRKEILVGASNRQSPSIVSRYDRDGKLIGTYRHFGHLNRMLELDLNGDRKEEVLMFGFNDSGQEEKSRAVIVALDPALIVGDRESSSSGGFGYPVSSAEMYYVLIPENELVRALHREVFLWQPKAVSLHNDCGFRVVASGSSEMALPVFEYIFTCSMNVVEVKSANDTKVAFDELVAQGKMKGEFYDGYLKQVAREVRYWTGKKWTETATAVQH